MDDVEVMVGEVAHLSAADSQDPDGDALTFAWVLRRKPPLSNVELEYTEGATLDFEPDRAGVYVVEVEVTDGTITVAATALVTALQTDQAPTADAGTDQEACPGLPVILGGSGSSDATGLPLVYEWSLLSAPAGSEAALSSPLEESAILAPDLEGTYIVQLVVHNGSLESDPDEVVVTVSAASWPDDVPNGVFHPGQVYLFGTVKPGTCGFEAIARLDDPDLGAVGFECGLVDKWSGIRQDGTVLYQHSAEGLLWEFHCDDCTGHEVGDDYPTDGRDNDIAHIPPCDPEDDLMTNWLVSPDGEPLYKCRRTNSWFNDRGDEVLSLGYTLLAYGHDERALTSSAVYDLATGAEVDITGLPTGTISAVRVRPTGFDLAISSVTDDHVELWHVDHTTGRALHLGDYAAPPPDVAPFGNYSRLDACGVLYQGATRDAVTDVVIRRTLLGSSEVVYAESDDPLVQMHTSSLLTGF